MLRLRPHLTALLARNARAPRHFHLRSPACASLFDTVGEQVKLAMKAKDAPRLASLRNMKAAFLTALKENNATELADDKAVEALRKLVKQRQDSIAQYAAGGRTELVDAEKLELSVIESFLPALADEATTEVWVREAITALGASKPGDAGKVMGAVLKAHKGEVDNALTKKIAEALLKA